MKYLVRAAVLLAGILFLAFILPRLISTNASEELDKFGFYSGSSSSQWQDYPVQYADPIVCNTCHADKHSAWVESSHKTVSCENCHGPGETHIEKGVPLTVNPTKELCLTCHGQAVGRPSDFPQIDTTVHGNQANCVTCHDPHSPFIPVIAHKAEGYSDCLLCHNSGGLKPYPADHQDRTSDSCLSCHGVE